MHDDGRQYVEDMMVASDTTSTTSVLQYFTVWCLLLVIFSKTTHVYLDLLMTSLFVLVCGSYLTYVFPRSVKFRFCGHAMTIEGWKLRFLDVITHVLPFLYIAWTYGGHYIRCDTSLFPILNLCLLVLLYVSLFDVFKVYGVRTSDVVRALLIAAVIGTMYVCVLILA